MNCLVTGATGFVGRHVVACLLANGHTVTATASSAERAAEFDWFRRVTFIEYTIADGIVDRDLYHFFGKPDALLHLAWPDVSRPTDSVHTRHHLFAQYVFLTNLIENGLADLTITGSCFEYGLVSGPLDETLQSDPVTPYGLAKDTLRKFLNVLQTDYAFVMRWVRLFYMYGEGQHPHSLFSQLETAIQRNEHSFNMSAGEQLRDYLPVQEAARIICQLALQKRITGVINCCRGEPVSVRRLVEQQVQQTGATMTLNLGHYPYRNYEPMASWGTTVKLNQALLAS